MRFEPLRLPGAALIHPELHRDHRGAFARTWCRDEYRAAGLEPDVVQSSLSFNERRGTLRGLHFQWPPSSEAKTVRVTRGAIFDVLVDLRPASPTYLEHVGLELDEDSQRAVYIPPGIAHGFQTLRDRSEVLYLMSDVFAPALAATVRWDDARFGIAWPIADPVLSAKDAECPPFDAATYEAELARRVSAVRGERSPAR